MAITSHVPKFYIFFIPTKGESILVRYQHFELLHTELYIPVVLRGMPAQLLDHRGSRNAMLR